MATVHSASKPSKYTTLGELLRAHVDRNVRAYYSCNPHVNRMLRAQAYARAVRESKSWPPAAQCLCPWLLEIQ